MRYLNLSVREEEIEDRLKLVRTLLLSISVLVGFAVFSSEVSTLFIYTFIMSSLLYYALIVNRGPQKLILLAGVGVSGSFSIFNFFLLSNNGIDYFIMTILLSIITFPITLYALKPTTVSLIKNVCSLTKALYYIPYINFRIPNAPRVKEIRKVGIKIKDGGVEILYDNW